MDLAERGVQTNKKLIIKSLCNEREINKMQIKIDDVLSYRNTLLSVTGYCTADIMLNFKLKTQSTVLKPKKRNETDVEYTNYKNKSVKFEIDEKVLIRNSQMKGQNWLLDKVMKVLSGCRYLVMIGGRVKMVHIKKLKPSLFHLTNSSLRNTRGNE